MAQAQWGLVALSTGRLSISTSLPQLYFLTNLSTLTSTSTHPDTAVSILTAIPIHRGTAVFRT